MRAVQPASTDAGARTGGPRRPADRRRGPPRGPAVLVPMETRLHPPAVRPGFVRRPSLAQRLRGSTARLILLDAPVGYGKTSLLAEWHADEGDGRRFAWVSLDPEDQAPARFWTYVIQAVRRLSPDFGGEVLSALRAPGADFTRSILPQLVNELAACGLPLILVLDDYHRIQETRCHELLARFIEHMPENLQLVVATRSEPPLPLARLRAQQELMELRAADLCFSEEEARALVDANLDAPLDGSELALLMRHTEGWPAGLYLAALALRDAESPSDLLRDFNGSQQTIADYLSGEVLESQDEEVRRFLARISILEHFSAPLCDAVVGVENAAAILREMERSNLFLVPLDGRRAWYRCHPLFRDVLHGELERTEPGVEGELHRRASDWYERHGLAEEAIRHAAAAGDRARRSDLIGAQWFEYVNAGRIGSVCRWLNEAGDEALAGDPQLALVAAWVAALTGDREALARWLPVAACEDWVGPIAGGFASLASGVVLVRAFGFEGLSVMLSSAQRAVELEADPSSPWYAAAHCLLGAALYLHGDAAAARSRLAEAARRSRRGPPLVRAVALAQLALIASDQGRHAQAEKLAREAGQTLEEAGLADSPQSSFVHTALGRALAGSGQLAEAAAELDRALTLRDGVPGLSQWPIIQHRLVHAPVRAALGDRAGAEALLAEARPLLEADPDASYLRRQLDQAEAALGHPSRRWLPRGGALSKAELEVLHLLPSALSRREIAQQLYLSLNTVCSHTRAIFRKLDVSCRDEAVTRARAEGLLPPAEP